MPEQLPRDLWLLCTAFAGCFGASVGSFLNVCIYRIPAGKSVVRPGSHCACGKPIAWYDNIPVLSWLILRGRRRPMRGLIWRVQREDSLSRCRCLLSCFLPKRQQISGLT